jgi:drug/metabolite transporter (DMT)-like permease
MKNISKRILPYLFIQSAVAIYSFSGVASKLASQHRFLSLPFILYYGLEIACLGVYAIIWQQIVKRFDLSVAYVNRSLSLLWSLLWSVLLFRESITLYNVVGMVIIISGVILVNTSGEGAEK